MPEPRPSRPVVVANPRDDEDFVAHVDALVERAPDGAATLELLLRARYPDAVVRQREISGEPREMWYVYRDGRWTPLGTGGGGTHG
jgi:hypothetical protein